MSAPPDTCPVHRCSKVERHNPFDPRPSSLPLLVCPVCQEELRKMRELRS